MLIGCTGKMAPTESLSHASLSGHMPEGQTLIGDMLLDKSAFTSYAVARPAFTSGFKEYDSAKWPGGVVPVAFGENVNSEKQQIFLNACLQWSSVASVSCQPHVDERDYLYVTADANDTCYTSVGMATEDSPYKMRHMNMHPVNCWEDKQVLHELGHVLGLMHEHQRADRDEYITVDASKIVPEFIFAYEKMGSSKMRLGTIYDYCSIMHYPGFAYSINGDDVMTMAPNMQANYGYQLGGRRGLSRQDRKGIAAIYGLDPEDVAQAWPPPAEYLNCPH